MHINISARGNGKPDPLPCVIAGILEKIEEMTLFLNPCEESYRRLGHDKAPRYVTWSAENRSLSSVFRRQLVNTAAPSCGLRTR